MITTGKIVQIIDEKLEGSPLFCVEVKVRNNNRIQVFIDGDQGVLIKDCVDLSRHLETQLDRDTEDFELEVSSAGLDQPLKNHRQFVKNIGQSLKIRLNDGTQLSGELKTVAEKSMEILVAASKKEKTAEQLVSLPFSQVEEAKIVIKFK
jgi:ribosome maturation factor RimP